MNTTTPKALKMKKELVKHPRAYLEAVGKQDLEPLEQLLNITDDQKAVMRLYFGASTDIPVRALSYVASAALASTLLPVDQLQIVSVCRLGKAVNGTPLDKSMAEFELFSKAARSALTQLMPDVAEKTIFAFDTECPAIEDIKPAAQKAIESDPDLRSQLHRRGAKHGGDFMHYTAAHTVFQDTNQLVLDPLDSDAVDPDIIVSIGCQQEKIFYAARLATKQLVDPDLLVPSVQIFTKHVSAPYFESNGGEQLLRNAQADGNIIQPTNNIASCRDMAHFEEFILKGVHS